MIHFSRSGLSTFRVRNVIHFPGKEYDSLFWVRNTNESIFGSGIWSLFLLRNMNPFPGQTKIRFSGSDYDSSVRAITLLEVTVPFLSTKIWTFVHIRTAALTMSWFMSPACYIWSWPIPYCCMYEICYQGQPLQVTHHIVWHLSLRTEYSILFINTNRE